MLNILLLFIFIRPFISSRSFFYPNTVYSTLLFIFLSIWIIRVYYGQTSLKNLSFLKKPLLVFSLALIISTAFSANKIKAFTELYKHLCGIFLFILAASLNAKDRMRLIKTLVVTGLIISLFAAYQYFFGFSHLINYMAREKIDNIVVLNYIKNRRSFFPFITPNTLAGYIIMIIPLALIFKKSFWLAIPLVITLIFTKSIGALSSLLLTLTLYFYLQAKIDKKRIIFLSGILTTIGLIFLIRWIGAQKEYFHPSFSVMMRWGNWKETIKLIEFFPFTGVGIGNFNLAQSRFAHNIFLQIWAETGILGLISFLWMLFIYFAKEIKYLKANNSQNYITTGIIISSAAFLCHNLIDFTFFMPEVALIWWLIMGLNIPENTSTLPKDQLMPV